MLFIYFLKPKPVDESEEAQITGFIHVLLYANEYSVYIYSGQLIDLLILLI